MHAVKFIYLLSLLNTDPDKDECQRLTNHVFALTDLDHGKLLRTRALADEGSYLSITHTQLCY